MEKQKLIIKDGKIQLRLNRVGDKPTIVEVPEEYKDRVLLDMWSETEIKAFNTLTGKPELFVAREFKGWVLNKKTNELRLIKYSNELMKVA